MCSCRDSIFLATRVDANTTQEEVEEVAAEVRRSWGLASGPVDNAVRTLEKHGVIAARFPVESEQVVPSRCRFPIVLLWSLVPIRMTGDGLVSMLRTNSGI